MVTTAVAKSTCLIAFSTLESSLYATGSRATPSDDRKYPIEASTTENAPVKNFTVVYVIPENTRSVNTMLWSLSDDVNSSRNFME